MDLYENIDVKLLLILIGFRLTFLQLHLKDPTVLTQVPPCSQGEP